MLTELLVKDLGIVDEIRLELDRGLTVVTGETGAGKTLIVDAIGLLVGVRAEGVAVRAGAAEAVIEGRFDHHGEEIVLKRVVPASGRSRAYVNGEMATATTLAEVGARLVDLHAQHAHQDLLTTSGQRSALDLVAHVDGRTLAELHQEIRALDGQIAALGGDPASRQREAELLRFQLDELVAAGLADPNEDEQLAAEQGELAHVVAHRERAAQALAALAEDGGVLDALATVVADLEGQTPFSEVHGRMAAAAAELADATSDLRARSEGIVDDPDRLAAIGERRQLLASLARKFGDGTIPNLIAVRDELQDRYEALVNHEARAEQLQQVRSTRCEQLAEEAARVAQVRRAAAPKLAARVQRELRALALPRASVAIEVGAQDPGDDVRFLLTTNPGSPPLPLAKVASGGELARTMLALRLVMAADQETVVFDEVDAGIGGTAASAVGAALARLGSTRQVLVVTHLAQVAAAASSHIGVTKVQAGSTTTTDAEMLGGESRVVELSRMLSGQPESDAAHAHARELLAVTRGTDDDD